MPNSPLAGIKACVFDAYGTLFDVAAAARACRDVLGNHTEPVSALWRDKQLQYTWLRAAQDRHADFWQVTGDALDFTLETFGLGGFGHGAEEGATVVAAVAVAIAIAATPAAGTACVVDLWHSIWRWRPIPRCPQC